MKFVIDEQILASANPSYVVLVSSEGICVPSNDQELTDCGALMPYVEYQKRHTLSELPLLIGSVNAKPIALALCSSNANIPNNWQWLSVRTLATSLNDVLFSIVSRASQLSSWLMSSKFCGVCGCQTQLSKSDRAFVCVDCHHRIYPKISPCVIGIVKRGDEILLAQGIEHREGLHSALAGFIESGESAEQAFAREVKEEVGIDICNIRYHSSQSWPFPGQLMLGFIADHEACELELNTSEIVKADWFTADALPEIPAQYTIAGQLIRHALKGS